MPSQRSPALAETPRSQDPPPADFATQELRLPAKASELHRARDYADRAAASFGFGEPGRVEFVYAVNEAVTNAIRHGTADKAGTIGLHIVADGDRLTVDVCDCGPFVAPATDDDEPMADHGRGFDLMAKLVDDVEVRARPEGTTVRLGTRRRGVGTGEVNGG